MLIKNAFTPQKCLYMGVMESKDGTIIIVTVPGPRGNMIVI